MMDEEFKRISKVLQVKNELLHQIEINNFPRGSVLPPERLISQQLGISYMTVRKGINELVAEGYLERNPGVGTFVRKDISPSRVNRILGIVCPAWNAPEVMDFTIHATRIAESHGWTPKIFFPRFWWDKLLEDAWDECDALMMLSLGDFSSIPDTLKKKFDSKVKSSVIVGVDASQVGFDSVLGSVDGVIMAMDKLKAAGHRRIALVGYSGGRIDDGVIRPVTFFADYWRERITEELGAAAADELYFCEQAAPYELEHEKVYRRLMSLKGPLPFTAVIVPYALFWGVSAALHDLGVRIPEDVSVVTIGDRQEGAYYRPRPACSISSLKTHVEKAMEMILKKHKEQACKSVAEFVEAVWWEGDTICEPAGRD